MNLTLPETTVPGEHFTAHSMRVHFLCFHAVNSEMRCEIIRITALKSFLT